MPNRPAPFKMTDLRRAVSVAMGLGLTVTGYEITPEGKIVVNTGQTDNAADAALANWQRGQRG